MSNPNVIIHGRDPENRHFAIRTDDQGYLETRTVSETPVASIVYDLELLSIQLYADSQNFSVGTDPYGRNGWYGVNTATTGGSNCYWYSNSLVPQNHMTKAQIECAYNIIALDRVEPTIVLPFVLFYSAPTGINDQIPGFAHSIWTYTIPSNARLNAGETVMLVAGLSNKITNIRPEVRRVVLELTGEAGECGENELIDYISLNTDSGLKEVGAIQYLLQNAGFFYTVTGKATDYVFSNSIDRRIKEVLLSTDNGGLNVNIVGGGGGGSGGLVQIQGYSGTGWVNITATDGALNTNDTITHTKLTDIDNKLYQANITLTNIEDKHLNYQTDSITVTGNVEINNFPTSFEVSSLPSVEINNFPTSFEVSNFPTSFEVSNFPTSFEVSNFPTSFEVSNTVSVYDSNSEAINQKLTLAAAPNNDCIKVFQANNPTSIQVSNFPASQAVTGTFWQATQPVSGTFWQATQPVSGSVSVSNLPATQVVSGTVGVSNFPESQAVTGTFWQATQPVSGS